MIIPIRKIADLDVEGKLHAAGGIHSVEVRNVKYNRANEMIQFST